MPKNPSVRTERRLLGGAVKLIREARKIKQDTLAQKAGMTPAYLSRLERGERFASLEAMCNIANALGANLNDITYTVNVFVVDEDAA